MYVHDNPINHIDPLGLNDTFGRSGVLWDYVVPDPVASFHIAQQQAAIAFDSNKAGWERTCGGVGMVAAAVLTATDVIPGKSGLQRGVVGGVEKIVENAAERIAKDEAKIIERKVLSAEERIGSKVKREEGSAATTMGDVATPETTKNFDQARREAFEKAKMTDQNKVQFTKVDPKTGTVVEFKGPDGAKVSYDTPHASPGPAHNDPHVGWQTGGKRNSDGAERGNIPYSGQQHPSRSPIKGEGALNQD